MKSVTCFAPATVANVAVGFDILGFSFPAVGDEVSVARMEQKTVVIDDIGSLSHVVPEEQCKDIPYDAARNTATAGLLRLVDELKPGFGFRVTIKKGIPLGSGMGGSAASAVGALVAANRFLDPPLPKEHLLRYALIGEAVASGATHPDNVTPCLYGGLTLTRSVDPLDVVPLALPESVFCVLVHPHARLDTREARAVLKPEILLVDHVRQSSNLAGFIAGCFRNDIDLIKRSMSDILIEPQRQRLIPAFGVAKKTALDHGALGCSISGSGPSLFAWAASETSAMIVREGIVSAIERHGLKADSWVSPLSMDGARIMKSRTEA